MDELVTFAINCLTACTISLMYAGDLLLLV